MFSNERRSLLSSQARIQTPWIKVTIGDYTFGIFNKTTKSGAVKDSDGFYTAYQVQYPNFVKSLDIVKINGQINQYTLSLSYPVTQFDDPNFFEKVFSSVSNTRKIVFSYGDASLPTYSYKDEEAIITGVQQTFSFGSGGNMGAVINYTVSAVSNSTLGLSGSYTFNRKYAKPSTIIKDLFRNNTYRLRDIFTGMTEANLNSLIAGNDKEVDIDAKQNISIIDYLTYLVSCMIPVGTPTNSISKDIYILTIHDDTIYDSSYKSSESAGGPYFKVSRVSYAVEQSDAYELDIGYNTRTLIRNFSINQNENYSIYYDYQEKLLPEHYVRRINNKGEWEDVFAPNISSKNNQRKTEADDITWWTKITKYPINATVTVQGLLRPATLMTYVRLNVIFPGGHKHISSGLYIITSQKDTIDESGYYTQLGLTRISGDLSSDTTTL